MPNEQFFSIVEKSIASGESVEIRVRGSSMYPALRDNSHRVVLVPWKREYLRVGMMALIRWGGRHVLHRLVAIQGEVLVFRGDNLPYTVEKVGERDIVAFVRSVIDPQGRVTDSRGWRFAIASGWAVLSGRPRAIFLAKAASLRVRLGKLLSVKKPESGNGNRIKVLFFIESLVGGGAEKILATIAGHIDKKRFDVTVCSVTDTGIHVEQVSRHVRFRPMIRTRNRLLYSILYHLIYYVLPPGWVYRLFMPQGRDVEVAFCEGFATRLLARSPVSRKIAWVHTDLESNPWTQKVVYRSVEEEREAYSKYSTVVCVSETVRESFRRRFGLEAVTLYNPLDSEDIVRRSEEKIALPPKRRIRFVSSGRLVEQKGYDRLLKVAKRLRDEGCDFELWILGDGEQMDSLRAFIAEAGLGDRVAMCGFMDNPYPWVASADAFVCSSRSEGYSTAATEAIILGVPVVTTLCSGMRELLGDDEYGWIVGNEDDALYEPLKKIADNPSCLRDLKSRAKRRGGDFTLSATLAPIEELLA